MYNLLPTLLFLTTTFHTIAALPHPNPIPSATLQSPLGSLANPDGSWATQKRDTTPPLTGINPATHGIPEIQPYSSALSSTTAADNPDSAAQDQTAAAAGPAGSVTRRRARRAVGGVQGPLMGGEGEGERAMRERGENRG